jgi:SsrA-binding protein
LLLNRNELQRLAQQSKIKGYTIIPLNFHLKRGRIKLEIALAKGKKMYDKRQSLRKKEEKRQIERDLKKLRYN